MTTVQEKELKIQGVVEASQDPNSSVTSQDVQKKIVDEAKKAGIPAFSFDPNATTAEKRAQTREVSSLRELSSCKALELIGVIRAHRPSRRVFKDSSRKVSP